MEISALEIEGEVHARLSALESFYSDVAAVGKNKPASDSHHEKASSIAYILKQLQELRLHFNCLRQRHAEALRSAIAGNDVAIQLSYQEALLVDTIRDLHTTIWARRRREVEELAKTA